MSQGINKDKHPSVLFIIVTYNGMKWVDKCVGCLDAVSLSHEVYVVDNGSTDGTQAYIKEHYPKTIFVQSEKNLGFGKANNLGLEYALKHGFDYVYLLNQDAWVFPGTVEKLVEVQQKHTEYGILSPMQMQANKKGLDGNFAQITCSYKSNQQLISDLYLGNVKDIYDVYFAMAAHWLISRDCLEKVGGFSPSFPHYGEDDNFINRAKYHGYNVGIVPSSQAVHDRGSRKTPPKKEMYIKCFIAMIVLLSNPAPNKLIEKFMQWFGRCTLFSLKYFSLDPTIYLFKLLVSYPRFRKNLALSKIEGTTFLNIK